MKTTKDSLEASWVERAKTVNEFKDNSMAPDLKTFVRGDPTSKDMTTKLGQEIETAFKEFLVVRVVAVALRAYFSVTRSVGARTSS